MKEQPSDRLIDHRIRNRTINVVSTLPDGDDGGVTGGFIGRFWSHNSRDARPLRRFALL